MTHPRCALRAPIGKAAGVPGLRPTRIFIRFHVALQAMGYMAPNKGGMDAGMYDPRGPLPGWSAGTQIPWLQEQ